ncbi:Protein NKG7 [Tupaia chinensis]|uniref:Protein NKG7 n=1 Tax=Tupaia chinensis TaxID=246437 RepID=L9L335_TUPCH|nr:Protein NKG7 [Tupaia chinensis]
MGLFGDREPPAARERMRKGVFIYGEGARRKPTSRNCATPKQHSSRPLLLASRKPRALPMEPYRNLALLAGCLGLTSSLVALSTNFWFVAAGPSSSAHSGLWPAGPQDSVAGKGEQALWGVAAQGGRLSRGLSPPGPGYIHVTQSFCILAALWDLVSVGFLVLSCIPSLSAPGRGPLVSTIAAFAAALSMTVAMAVYTTERWGQPPHPQIQTFFSWSFYLGWVSALFSLCAGVLSLGAHCNGPRPGYENL